MHFHCFVMKLIHWGRTAWRVVFLRCHFGRGGGGDGRSSFSLTAAIRLARGPSGSTTGLGGEAVTGVEAAEVTMSTSAPTSRGRLGILSPVDWRMARSVCHPGDERSWNASARSCCVATRPKSASSSYKPATSVRTSINRSSMEPRKFKDIPSTGHPSGG